MAGSGLKGRRRFTWLSAAPCLASSNACLCAAAAAASTTPWACCCSASVSSCAALCFAWYDSKRNKRAGERVGGRKFADNQNGTSPPVSLISTRLEPIEDCADNVIQAESMNSGALASAKYAWVLFIPSPQTNSSSFCSFARRAASVNACEVTAATWCCVAAICSAICCSCCCLTWRHQ